MLFALVPGRDAAAQTNLLTNGSFTPTGSTSYEFGTYSGYTPTETLTGWTSNGYNFVFLPTSTIATGQYGNLSLWSTTNGAPSNVNTFNNAGPTGGDFIGADSSVNYHGAITQTVSNLVVGSGYKLSFAWAGAQQYTFTGVTSEEWQVTFGTQTQTTQNLTNIPSEGFTGWMNQAFYFVATSTSEVLSFLANGTPPGVPPFALLANASLVNVPEPSTLAVLFTGATGLIAVARRRPARSRRRAQRN